MHQKRVLSEQNHIKPEKLAKNSQKEDKYLEKQ